MRLILFLSDDEECITDGAVIELWALENTHGNVHSMRTVVTARLSVINIESSA